MGGHQKGNGKETSKEKLRGGGEVGSGVGDKRRAGAKFKPKSIEQLMRIDLLPLLWLFRERVTF